MSDKQPALFEDEPARYVDPPDTTERRRRLERRRREFLASRKASKAGKPGPTDEQVAAALELYR